MSDRIEFTQSEGGETVVCTAVYGAMRFTRNVDVYQRVIILKIKELIKFYELTQTAVCNHGNGLKLCRWNQYIQKMKLAYKKK